MKRSLILAAAFACAASSMNGDTNAQAKCSVPKAWGRLVMVFPQVSAGGRTGFDALVFEDEAGTLRKTDLDSCKKGKAEWEVSRH
jgi:hypothetical protein